MKPKKIKGENTSLERQLEAVNTRIAVLDKVVIGWDIEAAMVALSDVNALLLKKEALENRLRRLKDLSYKRAQDAKIDPSFSIAR